MLGFFLVRVSRHLQQAGIEVVIIVCEMTECICRLGNVSTGKTRVLERPQVLAEVAGFTHISCVEVIAGGLDESSSGACLARILTEPLFGLGQIAAHRPGRCTELCGNSGTLYRAFVVDEVGLCAAIVVAVRH